MIDQSLDIYWFINYLPDWYRRYKTMWSGNKNDLVRWQCGNNMLGLSTDSEQCNIMKCVDHDLRPNRWSLNWTIPKPKYSKSSLRACKLGRRFIMLLTGLCNHQEGNQNALYSTEKVGNSPLCPRRLLLKPNHALALRVSLQNVWGHLSVLL